MFWCIPIIFWLRADPQCANGCGGKSTWHSFKWSNLYLPWSWALTPSVSVVTFLCGCSIQQMPTCYHFSFFLADFGIKSMVQVKESADDKLLMCISHRINHQHCLQKVNLPTILYCSIGFWKKQNHSVVFITQKSYIGGIQKLRWPFFAIFWPPTYLWLTYLLNRLIK